MTTGCLNNQVCQARKGYPPYPPFQITNKLIHHGSLKHWTKYFAGQDRESTQRGRSPIARGGASGESGSHCKSYGRPPLVVAKPQSIFRKKEPNKSFQDNAEVKQKGLLSR